MADMASRTFIRFSRPVYPSDREGINEEIRHRVEKHGFLFRRDPYLVGNAIPFEERYLGSSQVQDFRKIFGMVSANEAEFHQDMRAHVGRLPPHILDFLRNTGISFVTAPSAGHSVKEWWTEQGRGLEGKTVNNGAAGLYEEGAAKIHFFGDKICRQDDFVDNCERYRSKVAGHEVGHAVDMYLGHISQSEAFLAAYERDMMKNCNRDGPRKYLQTKENGGAQENARHAASEAFADIFEAIIRKDAVEMARHEYNFPEFYAAVRRLEDSLATYAPRKDSRPSFLLDL